MAERPEMIRTEIEQTRAQMGDTLDALGYKANVPARAKGWAGRKKDGVTGAFGSGISRVSGMTDSMVSRVSGTTDSMVSKVSGVTPSTGDITAGAGRLKDTAERNPFGLAIAGAAFGFVAGLFAPSTSMENEKLGAMSDQVKTNVMETGQEAIQHGQQIVQAAAQSAVETAQTETTEHSQQLSESVQEKAREVTPGS